MPPNAKSLSCRRCRERKVRCDRSTPCRSCIRYGCAAECRPYRLLRRSTHNDPLFHSNIASDGGNGQRTDSHFTGYQDQLELPLNSNSDRSESQLISDPSQREAALNVTQQLSRSPLNSREGHAEVAMYQASSKIYPTPSSDNIAGAPADDLRRCAPKALPKHLLTITALQDQVRLDSLTWGPDASPQAPTAAGFGVDLSPSEATAWRVYLTSCLPLQSQCCVLVSYFFENIQWVYQAIHAPSFYEDQSTMWARTVGEVDLISLALYYVVLSLSALYIDTGTCEDIGLIDVRKKAHWWFRLSRQCLQAGEYDSRPCLAQILVYLESQLYWYATKRVESLNSALGQTVRCAQALGLDKDTEPSTDLASEMRHRLWWDLCSADTFQSLCLDRQPLLQCYHSRVPFPLNANDSDLTANGTSPRPLDQPTRMTMHVYRAKTFKALNRLYLDNASHMDSFEWVSQTDEEVLALMDNFPWYMNMAKAPFAATNTNPEFDYIRYQHHLLQSSLCMQRIRMYRPFLKTIHHNDCWPRCIAAIENIFAVYHAIRNADGPRFQRSQKRLAQSYQIFCAAVSTAVFVLVERPTLRAGILKGVETVIEDLDRLVAENRSTPLAVEGRTTLKTLLQLCRRSPEPPDGKQPENWQALVAELYAYVGGKSTTKAYLESRRQHRDLGAAVPESGAQNSNDAVEILEQGATDADAFLNYWPVPGAFDSTVHFDMLNWGVDDLVHVE